MKSIVRTLQNDPFPYVLHRTAVRDTTLGSEQVKAGERVVLGIASATREQPGGSEVLFGGDYDEQDPPTHACPGRKMAFGTILGIASALLRAGELRPEGSSALLLKV